MHLFSKHKIAIKPGKVYSSEKPGMFRICFTKPNVSNDGDLVVAMTELKKRLLKWKDDWENENDLYK